MNSNSGTLAREIHEAMAQVRGARVHPDSVGSVDAALHRLCEEATDRLGAGNPAVAMLGEAEAAFRDGDTVTAIQRLSAALIRVTRSDPRPNR